MLNTEERMMSKKKGRGRKMGREKERKSRKGTDHSKVVE